jgi:hypothetical protein
VKRSLATREFAVGLEGLESPFLLLGPLEHLVETLQARRERWGLNYVVIFERALADFAPVVARLAGN